MGETEEAQKPLAKILVAEDNPISQKMTCTALRRLGFEAEIAINGEEAAIKGKTGDFDLILMDIHMPVLDGVEAAKRIREHEGARGEYTPIIAMTALTREKLEEKVREGRMEGYLKKPFELHQLKYILNEQLKKEAVDGASAEKNYYFAELFDWDHFLGRCMDDRELAVHLLESFLEDLPEYLETLGRALEAGDRDRYVYHLYKLRGAAGNICAGEIFHLTGELIRRETAGDADDARRGFQRLSRSIERFRSEVNPRDYASGNSGRQ